MKGRERRMSAQGTGYASQRMIREAPAASARPPGSGRDWLIIMDSVRGDREAESAIRVLAERGHLGIIQEPAGIEFTPLGDQWIQQLKRAQAARFPEGRQ